MRLRFGALALAAALTAVASPPASAQEAIKLTVAVVNANFAQYFIAQDKGYFKDEGLNVEVVVAPGGVATPGLLGGSVHYSGSPSSAMSAILKGAPLKIILVGQSRPIYELWSFDPEVKTFDQLKGKLIAVGSRGGTDEISVRMLLKQKNLPNDFVGFAPLGMGPTRMAAIVAGQQKFTLLSRTDKGQAAQAGLIAKGHMLSNVAREVELQTGGIVTTEKELAQNRDRARRILRAVWKGTIYMRTEKEGTIAVMQNRLPQFARAVIVRDVEGAIADVDADGVMDEATAARELAVRAEVFGVARDKVPPVERVYDFSIVRDVIRELATANWKPAM
ncbi:MAG TPA: ABC transporter substrate-binding protein [Alphaproteobacteria bacterium]